MARHSNVYLFLGLLVFLGVEPFLQGLAEARALVPLAYTAILILGVFSFAEHRHVFRAGIGLGVIAIAAGVGYLVTDAEVLRIIDLASVLCFSLLAIVVKLRQVLFVSGEVTLNRLVGAMCVYLLLGVVWSILFTFVAHHDPEAFQLVDGTPDEALDHLLYYSFATLTTLGYGDIRPVHAVARTLAYLEAVTGQLYLAVLIAGLLGRYIAGAKAKAA